jgi:hypothetical protein
MSISHFPLSFKDVKEIFEDDLPDKYTKLLQDQEHLLNQARLRKAFNCHS